MVVTSNNSDAFKILGKDKVSIEQEYAIIDDIVAKVEFLNTHMDILPDFVLRLKIAPRLNTIVRPYSATCRCGHDSSRHWQINGDLKNCKNCDCEAFYE